MKFIQRILSHSLLIAVVAIVFLAWYYRADILPETFGPQATVAEEKTKSPEVAPKPTPDAAAEKTSIPVSAAPLNPDLPPMADAQPEDVAPESDTIANTNDLPPLASAAPVVNEELQPDYQQQTGSSEAADQVSQSTDRSEKLTAARQAFWQYDFTTAEQHYQDLVSESPDDVDALGELGNLYYQQRRWDQAADVYFRAGQILIKEGMTERAYQLLRVLWNLNPDRARQLEVALSQ